MAWHRHAFSLTFACRSTGTLVLADAEQSRQRLARHALLGDRQPCVSGRYCRHEQRRSRRAHVPYGRGRPVSRRCAVSLSPRAGDATSGSTSAEPPSSSSSRALSSPGSSSRDRYLDTGPLVCLNSSPYVVLACLAATVLSCLLVLFDGGADWPPAHLDKVLLKNVTYSIAEVAVLILVTGLLHATAFSSPGRCPSVGGDRRRRRCPRHTCRAAVLRRDRRKDGGRRQRRRSSAIRLATTPGSFPRLLAYRTIPPLLGPPRIGADRKHVLYPPWLIATSLNLMTTNMSISLVVEGSLNRGGLPLQARQALQQTARLILPIAAVLFVGAPWVLRIFGPNYASEGAGLLRLLAVSLIPSSICVLGFGVARIRDRVGAIIATQVPLAVLVLGLSAILLPSLGPWQTGPALRGS